jgi:hypothetical protein
MDNTRSWTCEQGQLLTLLAPASSSAAEAWAVEQEVIAALDEQRARCGPALEDCGKMTVCLKHKKNPRRGAAVKVRCGRLRCEPCRLRIRATQTRHALLCILRQLPEGGVPAEAPPDLPTREGDLWLWSGPAREWRAIQARIYRSAEDSGATPGYLRVEEVAQGRVTVITEAPLPGAGRVTPGEAMLWAAARIRHAPLRKGAVSWGGAWRRPVAERQYERLDAAVPIRQAVDWATLLGAAVRGVRPGGQRSGVVRGQAWQLPEGLPAEAVELFYRAVTGGGLPDLERALEAAVEMSLSVPKGLETEGEVSTREVEAARERVLAPGASYPSYADLAADLHAAGVAT